MPIPMAFLLLNNRSLVQPLPRKIVLDLIAERRTLWCAPDCSHRA